MTFDLDLNFNVTRTFITQDITASPVDSGDYASQCSLEHSSNFFHFPDGLKRDIQQLQVITNNMEGNVLATSYLSMTEKDEICRMMELIDSTLSLIRARVSHIDSAVHYKEQSGQEVNGNKGANIEYPLNVQFTDADGGFGTMVPGELDSLRYARDDNTTTLKDDLGRARRVDSFKWRLSDGGQGRVTNVWSKLFNDQFLNDRLTGHKLFRGNLCVKVVLNGNAFYHGRAQLCYRYFPELLNDAGRTATIGRGRSCTISQLPRILLNPTTSTGGTMKIPFHFHKDYIDLVSADYQSMGELEFDVLSPLEHAQAVLVDLDVNIYAWFEDVFVTGLTETQMIPQSGKEQDQANATGIVTHKATALGFIKRVVGMSPKISGLITATAKGARMISNAAALLGYSRPSITAEPMRYSHSPAGILASTTTPTLVEKLTVDDKQELTISPSIAGAGDSDPYDILSIASRDSYYVTLGWTGSDPQNTRLAQMKVNPLYIVRRGDQPNSMAFTAMAAAAFPFDYWTGSINFRFTVTCCGLHKGRLRIVYDPTGRVDPGVDDLLARSVVKVVDIAQEPDFVISVKPQQARTWLRCANLAEESTRGWGEDSISTVAPFLNLPNSSSDNGSLNIYVENQLTSVDPAIIPSVGIVVHVSAGDDFEVASPGNRMKYIAPYAAETQIPDVPPQSGMENDKGASVNHTEQDNPDRTDSTYEVGELHAIADKNLVYMGESIKSFRPLLKRYTLSHLRQIDGGGVGDAQTGIWKYTLPGHGIMPGEHDLASTTSGTRPYAFTRMSYYQYLDLMHAGHRGGVRWKMVFRTEADGNIYSCERRTSAGGILIDRDEFFITQGLGPTMNTVLNTYESIIDSGHSGCSLTNQTNGVLSVEVPYQHYHRFEPGKRFVYELTKASDSYLTVTHMGRQRQNTVGVNFVLFYTAAAEDYNNYFFTGLPLMRLHEGS